MVESFNEISFEECKESADYEKVLNEKLGITFAECYQALNESLQARAAEIAEDLPTMAPNGDYGQLMEDAESIAKFLREEAAKPENWKIEYIEVRKATDQLMELVFVNTTIDEGDILKGFVFVGLSGKIRHAFTQVQS